MYGSLVLHKSNNGTEIHDAGKPLTDEFIYMDDAY